MSPPPSTPDHVPAANQAQARWFVDEVHRHDASLKNYVRNAFPGVRDVDDVVQESYLRVWRRHLVRPITEVSGTVRASVKSFLFQVARRLALDTIRHERVSPFEPVVDLTGLPAAEERDGAADVAAANQEFQLLLDAIDRLPGRCREVVVLRKLQGLSPAETARRLGISEETVHVQARRGLQRVQEHFRKQGVLREYQP
ncbi:MAG: RNA polymerase sigma factor [Opitutaceae bacterium]|nr:RNA polymerase sigma factor [Opitutaceae bacterium]